MGLIGKISEIGKSVKMGLDSMVDSTPRFEGPKFEKTDFGKNSVRVKPTDLGKNSARVSDI